MKRTGTAAVVTIAFALACASDRAGRKKLADGSYELECRKPLADCLAELTDVCRDYGYDVVRAKEEKKRYGVEPVLTEVVTSNATVRCRSGQPLLSLGGDESPERPAPAPARSAAPRCFPGGTQACLGPGACKGAQTCKDDGAGYGACDCGPPPAPPAAPDADAGPPSTWTVPAVDGGAAP